MRVAGNKEGEGGKAMAKVTRLAGKRMATAKKRAMEMKSRLAGKREGNGKGGKSDGNSKEESNCKG